MPTVSINTKTQPSLTWTAPVQPVHSRSKNWYLGGAVFVLVCAIWGLLIGNWTFTIAILLAGGLVFLVRNAPTPVKTMTITRSGFLFDAKFTEWSACKDFWVIQTLDYAELHIAKKSGLGREIVIQTGGLDPLMLRELLEKLLPQRHNQGEKLIDKIIRITKL